jgi:hypothetical protein
MILLKEPQVLSSARKSLLAGDPLSDGDSEGNQAQAFDPPRRGASRSVRAMHASLHEGLALTAAGGSDQALPVGLKSAFNLLGRKPLASPGLAFSEGGCGCGKASDTCC